MGPAVRRATMRLPILPFALALLLCAASRVEGQTLDDLVRNGEGPEIDAARFPKEFDPHRRINEKHEACGVCAPAGRAASR